MITLALIGAGSWGKNYITTINRIKEASLKYIFTRPAQTREIAKYKDIDGVIVATPAATHFTILKYLVPFGYNLLVEKPLATNYKDAEELEKIYRTTKSIIMVGHIYLYNAAYLKFRQLSRKIGEIQYLEFEGCNFGPFPKKSSALWEWAPHDVSMCLDLLSGMPLSVSAWSVGRDMVFARLKFKNTQAFMKLGWLSPVKRRRVIIVGSKSSLIFDDTKDKKVCLYENIGSDCVDDKKGIIKNKECFYPRYSKEEPLVAEVKEFVKCIKNKRKAKTDLEHGVKIVKVIQSMENSIINNGKTIYF